ncbi:MAG: TonB-dependent receptor [Opitutaceae bacterium]
MKSFSFALNPMTAAGVVLLSLAVCARAQVASNSDTKNSSEIVKLSDFNVSAEAERGYVASETVTGSRVATKIIDLPYTVNILTSEFFDDFAMFELADNITQIGSFTGLDIGGGFTLRGFGSTSQLRDGFYRLGRYGSSNVDRMEIIKGSNAAIYGRTSPGGMVNMISKQPRDREHYRLSLNYGDYDTQRGVFEATGPLFRGTAGKTSYVLTLSNYQKGFDIDYARNRNEEYYLAVKHTFADRSSLMVQGEFFHQTRHAPNSPAPMITDNKGTATVNDDEVIGYAKNLANYNAFGPNSELNRGNTSFTATYEKRLSEVWSGRVAGSYFRARRWDYNQNTGFGSITINPATPAPIATTRGNTPNKGLIMEDGGGFQADALAHYWTGNRSIEHRTLVTVDFNDYYRWDPTWNYGPLTNPDIAAWNAASSGRVITLDANYRPIAPLTYFPKFFQWGNEQLTRLTRRRTTVLGGLLRQQSSFMQGRLLTYVGVRFDAVRFQERDYTTTVGSAATAGTFRSFLGYANYNQGDMIRKSITQFKPNLGLNYKLTRGLRVFANYSESYFVNQTDNPIVFADPTYKPEIASGYDYGFKGDLLDGRLNFTASGFYAVRENVSVSQIVETPVGSGNFLQTNVRDGDQLVRGFELDANWRATDEISLNASWGHVYSIYTDFGSANPLSVGRRVNNVAPQNGSISAKWSPRSAQLKGFSANVGWTYLAATPSEAPNAGDAYTTTATGQRVFQRTTYQWRLRTPAFGLWNIGARYTLPGNSRWGHTFAVNVNNVTDRDYLRAGGSTVRQLGERRAFFFTYTLDLDGARR